MKETIEILRQELAICGQISDSFGGLRDILQQQSTAGSAISEKAHQLESLMGQLGQLEKRGNQLLKTLGQPSMGAYLSVQPDSPAKDMALRLCSRVEEAMVQLRYDLRSNYELLERSKAFVDYHMNVMTHAAAENTYGPPRRPNAGGGRGRKMFDQSI